MRAGFTLLILCLSALYAYWAFTDLDFLSSTGRLGPGFFPRIVGIALILACLVELTFGLVRQSVPPDRSQHAGTVLAVLGMTVLFVMALTVIGGFAAMVAFMLATLTILNRGHVVQNVVLSVSLASVVYLIFDVWLGAAIPRSMLLDRWLT